jgi:cytoskeleton protein RodZ
MSETIGKQLKHAREAKNLTIQKVVLATRIRAHQIEAIEADDFDSLPSPVQARAFLRLYSEYLGLSLDKIITNQRAGIVEQPTTLVEIEPVINGEEGLSTGVFEGSSLARGNVAGKKPIQLMVKIRELFFHSKVQPEPMEPEEASDASDTVLEETKEPAIQPEDSPIPHPTLLPSQIIFNSIGKALFERRESLSLNLDEIERHTHVGKHYLVALEDGEFHRLPSSVQARGMLNNYALFLDLDVDALSLSFAEGLQLQRLERQNLVDNPQQVPGSKSPNKSRPVLKFKAPTFLQRYLSVDIIVGGGLVALLLIFAIWGTIRIVDMTTNSTPQTTAAPIIDILVPNPEIATATSLTTNSGIGAIVEAPTAVESMVITLPAAGHGPVQVVVIAQNQAWVRVTVDGKIQFDGRVTPGTAYPFDGETQIEVLTGNGKAISILYNQNNLGPMGNFGEVVDHIYTVNAILNPTATFTPTPTITLTSTATLRPSPTLRPTSTPRPSASPRISPTPIP